MALSELYISPGRVGRRAGERACVGEEAHHELGASDIHLGKKKNPSSVNGISKYLLLCSKPVPQGDIWRKEKTGQIKIKDKLLFCSIPLSKDTKQTRQRIRMRSCVAAASRKWRRGFAAGRGPGQGRNRPAIW